MEVKKEKYLSYIKERYPEMECKSVHVNFTDGLHNDVVVINGTDVFRFAKHDFSKGLLNNEYKVLQIVKQFVDMSIPNLEFVDEGVARYTFIQGNPIYRNKIK